MKVWLKNIVLSGLVLILLGLIPQCKSYKSKSTGNLLFDEQYRPLFHFTPDSMWMNDPNGMVYYEGEYHLFYQYYPDSTVWGPMHWGHAVSKDLIHWEHLPIALYPDSLGYIFSGSAVIDWDNTSGFGSKENPPMVAIFTYHDMVGERRGDIDYQTQGIAYSLDKGRTWIKYEGNPVLQNPGIRDFRDPKVIWYEAEQEWIMTLAVKDRISFYSSKDLLSWQHESDFQSEIAAYGGVWECPDLFPLKSENSNVEKWVLLVSINPGAPNGGSGTQYFVGTFDGHHFTNENTELYWLDYGKDNYAGVTWSNIPENDGRRLFIGWMSNWQYATLVPTEKWRSAMTIPRTLTLLKESNNYRVYSNPVVELENIYMQKTNILVESDKITSLPFESAPQDINFTIKNNSVSIDTFSFTLLNDKDQKMVFSYDANLNHFILNRDKSGDVSFSDNFTGDHIAPFGRNPNEIKCRILLDVSSIEVFINDGELVMTDIFFPDKPFNRFVFKSSEKTKITSFFSYKLNDI